MNGKKAIRDEPAKPKVKDIREDLKAIVQRELALLPETLQGLDAEKRLNILIKLIPYVLPRVESVHPENGERPWDMY